MGGKVVKKKSDENVIKTTSKGSKHPLKKIIEQRGEGSPRIGNKNDPATPKFSSNRLLPDSEISSGPKSPKVKKSGFYQNRNQGKKGKILVKSKDMDINKDIENEYDVLEIVKRNNHEDLDHSLIETCIMTHFFMKTLEKPARNEIIKEMTLCQIKAGSTVFKQGSIGNFFYIVREGFLDLFINGILVKTLTNGDNFGELALLHGAPRSGTVVAKTSCSVWCLERRNFRKIIDHINRTNFEENKHFIQSISLFANIDPELKSILTTNLIKEYFSEGEFIVKAKDISNCLYIIKEGEVDCMLEGKSVRTLKKGDHFGEKSILMDCLRTMDVISKTDSVIYSISVDTLKNMLGDKYTDVLTFNFLQMAFKNSNFLNKISCKLLENCFQIFTLKNFEKGEIVIPSGHCTGTVVSVIIEGNLYNKKLNKVEFKRGDILFEESICSYDSKTKLKEKLGYDLTADPDCLILFADTETFIQYLGGPLKEIFKKSLALNSLNNIPLFKNLSPQKLSYLTSVISIENFENGTRIITQGDSGDTKFYIIKSGRVEIFKDGRYIRTFNENESFGTRALFFSEPRSATVEANGNVELYVITSQDFQKILEDKLLEYLKTKISLEDDSVTLKDLDFIKDLGAGSFGTVSLVKSRKTDFLYAIKAMSKAQIDYDHLHKNLELERDILLKVDHPFIMKLVKTMKNENFAFFLEEYIKGKELWDVIRDIGLLDKSQTQYYSASIMLAVDYLHQRKFVFRDIKPENVMVCQNGYIKLIDFGTCKEIEDRTSTIIGTPHYMAPEAILGEGYTFQVDFWSIAVCMFEFICGAVPFGEAADDPMEVYKMVVHGELKFPHFVKDREFMDLIRKMLCKSPIARLSTLTKIKAHPWFNDFPFNQLLNFDVEPPYKPKMTADDPSISAATYPYVNKILEIKSFKPPKEKKIEAKTQEDYDQWFKNF